MKHIISCEATERSGLKYFKIYEIRVMDNDGEVRTFDRYLSRSKAEEALSLALDVHVKYKIGWISKQIVWIG